MLSSVKKSFLIVPSLMFELVDDDEHKGRE